MKHHEEIQTGYRFAIAGAGSSNVLSGSDVGPQYPRIYGEGRGQAIPQAEHSRDCSVDSKPDGEYTGRGID